MAFLLKWKRVDGGEGAEAFDSQADAVAAALQVDGSAVVAPYPDAGSIMIFRDGVILDDEEAAGATQQYVHPQVIEVIVTNPMEPDTNLDPDDSTGWGWRGGTPATYGWRVVEVTGSGRPLGFE